MKVINSDALQYLASKRSFEGERITLHGPIPIDILEQGAKLTTFDVIEIVDPTKGDLLDLSKLFNRYPDRSLSELVLSSGNLPRPQAKPLDLSDITFGPVSLRVHVPTVGQR